MQQKLQSVLHTNQAAEVTGPTLVAEQSKDLTFHMNCRMVLRHRSLNGSAEICDGYESGSKMSRLT